MVCIMTYRKEHPLERRKVYWAGRSSSNHRGRGMDSTGKLVMESILETEAATILQFFAGLRGTLSVTFEEGTWSVWLYDLLNPHVDKLVVCNPRKNALLKDGNKSDRIDARKLAELLRGTSSNRSTTARTGAHAARYLTSDERFLWREGLNVAK